MRQKLILTCAVAVAAAASIAGAVTAQANSLAAEAPSVTLTSPQDGFSDIIGCPITFAATAQDTDGDVARVEFYVNGALVATDTTAPYEVEDRSSGYPYTLGDKGLHTALARAYDNGDPQLSTDSQTVTFRLTEPPPGLPDVDPCRQGIPPTTPPPPPGVSK